MPAPRVITDPVGTRRQFTATDLVRNQQITVNATLRARGQRAVMWVADSLNVADADIQRSLDEFGWDKIARLTVEVYQRAIDDRG